MNKKLIPALGVASSLGGPSETCAEGAKVLRDSPHQQILSQLTPPVELDWQPLLEVRSEQRNSLDLIKKQSCVISQFVQQQLEDYHPFVVLGGDHSIAMGTWAGVLNQLPEASTFALIWIDAHLDAHTLQTSHSGNLHGMPVSCLLGEADHALQSCFPSNFYLDARDFYAFGIRSYEADEIMLMSKLQANVFDTQRIQKDGGTVKVLEQLIETIARCYDYFAISLDLDAIDPADAPGVETREETGISADKLLQVFQKIPFTEKFIGLEIAEFDPGHDIDQKTEKLVYDIIAAVYSHHV